MLTDEQIAEVLETVADNFESGTFGWIRNRYSNEDGAYCAVGAIRSVVKIEDDANFVQSNAVARRLGDYLIESGSCARLPWLSEFESVIGWNDERCRTKEQVIEAFKQAAKNVRNAA